MSVNEFMKIWSGVILLAEPDSNSQEPDYTKHMFDNLFQMSKKTGLFLFALINLVFVLNIVVDKVVICLIFLNFIGGYISYLLLLKQSKIDSKVADSMCSMLNKHDCNNVLNTQAANLFSFSWSEIGFSYFVVNLIVLLYFPVYVNYVTWVNVIILPYSFWSIWYQYKVVHQWCVLCLIVQLLIWSIFLVNLLSGNIFLVHIAGMQILHLGSIYIFVLLLTNLLLFYLSDYCVLKHMLQGYNSIKSNDDVFKILRYKQKHFNVDKCTSKIMFGNSKASKTITLLINPHCSPCAKMHQRIQRVLNLLGDKACIQYVFSSFNDELLFSNRFLIATYFQKSKSEVESIYNKWFEWGRFNPQDFCVKYNLDLNTLEVETELENHELWKTENKLQETPLVLLEGYTLPEQYDVEDLIYLIDID